MREYESIFVVRPSVSEDGINQLVEKVKKVIEKNGGVVTKTEQWGKRKLAYEIKKEKKGTYVLLQLKGNGRVVSDLGRNYQLDDSIIKYLTICLEQPLVEQQAAPARHGGETEEG
jgi:small subunit ribosomal protein S6